MDAHMRAHEGLELPHPEHKTVMKLYVWDFGGQQIYHATHQFFLTDKALFVLVWNGRMGYTQCRVEYWLDMIKARAPGSPIVIVATHQDQRLVELPSLEEWQTKYNIVGQYVVSNKTGDGMDALKQSLAQAAARLPLMGREYPSNWVAAIATLQNRHMQYKKDPVQARNYLQIAELLGLLKHEYQMEEGEARVMLQWYHDLGGLMLYADDPELNDFAILNPWWVSRTINHVLDHADPTLDQGLFTRQLMDQVWHDVPAWLRPRFQRLMEKFDLSYRIPDQPGSSIIVGRLPVHPPDYQTRWQPWGAQPGCKELTLRYRFNSIPPGIPSWFIAREHRFSTGLHWRHGALLHDQEKKHLGLARSDPNKGIVELSVRGPYPHNFFALLMDGMELTIARFPGVEVERMLPCPCGSKSQPCTAHFEYQMLLKRLERGKDTVECPHSARDVSLHQLLFALRTGRQEDLLRAIDAKVTAGFSEMKEQNRALIALIQRGHTTIYNALQTTHATHCPNVFALCEVKQGKLRDTVTRKLELQLFCQEPGHWHPTEDGRYEFQKPAQWLDPIIPYAQKLLTVLRYAAPVVGVAIGSNGQSADGSVMKRMDQLLRGMEGLLPKQSAGEQMEAAGTAKMADGAALRQLRGLLDELDPAQRWGGLQKVFTAEGHYLWLCPEHAAAYQR
jgi:hypothetical protein